jgi:solute carrier family 25 carnitine/acylcarnitine transporter 20/29
MEWQTEAWSAGALAQVWAAEGVKGLFRGFGPALARSFPANAVCFAVYEATQSALSKAAGAGQQG